VTSDDIRRVGQRAHDRDELPERQGCGGDPQGRGGLALLEGRSAIGDVVEAGAVLQRQVDEERVRRHLLDDGAREVILRLHRHLDDGRAILDLFDQEKSKMTEQEIEAFLLGVLESCGATATDAAGQMRRLFAAAVRCPRGGRSRGGRSP
jgi:hypothetical protein